MGPQFCDSSNSSSKIEGEDDRLGARFSVGTLQFWCLENVVCFEVEGAAWDLRVPGSWRVQDGVVVTKTARASLTHLV